MGTNFYVRGHRGDADAHIGKRSAAGWYCWDCSITLCKSGAVHSGLSDWFKACPKCGKTIPEEPLETSSAGRELGFNKSEPQRKTGVASCASFSWAMTQERFKEIISVSECPCCGLPLPQGFEPIEDEYGRRFTAAEFQQMLTECPIQFTNMIGREFS